MENHCEICGRTREEAENLKNKRSDIQTGLTEDGDVTKCGSCITQYHMGELSNEEEKQGSTKKKAEKGLYKTVNRKSVGKI